MINWSVQRVQKFYSYLNEYFGLSVNPDIELAENNRFPVQWIKGKLLFVPEFFNDEELEEDVRKNLLVLMYSAFYQTKHNDNHIGMHPMFMAKGICDELGITFLSDEQIEKNLRVVRRKLYEKVEDCCFFSVGVDLRENAFTSYRVVKVENCKTDILVTVKPIGCKFGNPDKVFTEEELYKRCCMFESIDDVKIDMRKNLVIISGASGVGKTTVLKEVMREYPDLNKTISVTTRHKRSDEVEGEDYYFITRNEFYDYQFNGDLLEDTIYNNECYGTLISEIDKHPKEKPLALVINTDGRRNVLRHFPLSKTIFIQAPSTEELKRRIELRGENSEDEILERIETAFNEMEETKYYDYVVMNEDAKKCAEEITEIIKKILNNRRSSYAIRMF